MNLKQLEAFVQVAEKRSFSGAAREMYLTQPTVSAHISALESELGTKLLIRNTKEVSLSEDGQKLYEYAKQISLMVKQVEQEFQRQPAQKRKHCTRIAASTVPAQYLLPQILAKFSEQYPEEQFQVLETDSAKVVEHILERSVDIGLTGTQLEKMRCKYVPFYEDELIVITPNQEKFRKRKQQGGGIGWLLEEPVIMREEGSGTRKESEKILRRIGIAPEKLNIVASIENPETIKRSVSSGMGVTVISALAARDALEQAKVIGFSLGADDTRNINVVYNKNFPLSAAAKKFLQIVKLVYPDC